MLLAGHQLGERCVAADVVPAHAPFPRRAALGQMQTSGSCIEDVRCPLESGLSRARN